jgi:hypothetical protein
MLDSSDVLLIPRGLEKKKKNSLRDFIVSIWCSNVTWIIGYNHLHLFVKGEVYVIAAVNPKRRQGWPSNASGVVTKTPSSICGWPTTIVVVVQPHIGLFFF